MRIEDLSALIDQWPVDTAAIGLTDATSTVGLGGDSTWATPIASVGKMFVGLTALIAFEEGTIGLDDPAGPTGATVRHLLSHTAGYRFNEATIVGGPGEKRIYSNVGIDVFANHLTARSGMPFAEYVQLAVFDPLGMTQTELRGYPSSAFVSSVDDLLRFARELLRPTLISADTLSVATVPYLPTLPGIVPGFGYHDPNPWGLGFEVRGHKSPHWSGVLSSPKMFGHFGGAGTFLWVEPDMGLAGCALTDCDFGPWARAAWPNAIDAMLVQQRS